MKTIEQVKELLQGYKLGGLNQLGRRELLPEFRIELESNIRMIDQILDFIDSSESENG
jgi:hypothetical protein